MNRKTFDGLPAAAQSVIRKYSGGWQAKRYIEADERNNLARMEQLKSDPARKVIFSVQSELDAIDAASKLEIEKWLAMRPRNRVVFGLARTEAAKVQTTR